MNEQHQYPAGQQARGEHQDRHSQMDENERIIDKKRRREAAKHARSVKGFHERREHVQQSTDQFGAGSHGPRNPSPSDQARDERRGDFPSDQQHGSR